MRGGLPILFSSAEADSSPRATPLSLFAHFAVSRQSAAVAAHPCLRCILRWTSSPPTQSLNENTPLRLGCLLGFRDIVNVFAPTRSSFFLDGVPETQTWKFAEKPGLTTFSQSLAAHTHTHIHTHTHWCLLSAVAFFSHCCPHHYSSSISSSAIICMLPSHSNSFGMHSTLSNLSGRTYRKTCVCVCLSAQKRGDNIFIRLLSILKDRESYCAFKGKDSDEGVILKHWPIFTFIAAKPSLTFLFLPRAPPPIYIVFAQTYSQGYLFSILALNIHHHPDHLPPATSPTSS